MNKNKKLLTLVLILLLIGLVLFILEKTKVTNFYENTPASNTTTTNQPTINLDPPTEEEAKAGDEIKEDIIKNEAAQQQKPTDDKTKAEVVIVDSTQYDNEIEVRAFVSNVIKDGTCTFVFTNGSEKITKTMPAPADASSTPCMTLVVPRTEFSKTGTWNLTVSYANDTASGSATSTVGVQ